MDIKTFAEQLAHLSPSEAELVQLGISRVSAQHFRRSFVCHEQHSATGPNASEIDEFLTSWDCSNVAIGMLRFSVPQRDRLGNVQIGWVEDDPVMITVEMGEICVFEQGQMTHMLWAAATNLPRFLDALIPAADFLAKRAIGKIDFDDPGVGRPVAEKCLLLAGGEKYRNFYLMLLGVE